MINWILVYEQGLYEINQIIALYDTLDITLDSL